MREFPTQQQAAAMRAKYEGRRVLLQSMADDPNPVEPGSMGMVSRVDDAGMIHVRWDSGRSLSLIEGVDEFELV